ncbi:MAG: four helix bundle protein [Candidatus Moraniibacteriota bacterium]
MATYDNLPVFKTSYDMLLELFKVSNNFSRDYRFTIGEQIKKETIEMMMCVYRANKSFEGRKNWIGTAREKIETIRVLLRILKDLKQVSLKKFISINEHIESVSKQLAYWENSLGGSTSK